MFKFVLVAALFAVSSAQFLRLNPLSLGSAQVGEQHLIILGNGGSAPVARAQPVAAYVTAAGAGAARFTAKSVEEKPEPFAFGFESEDEFGTKMSRSESGDESGKVTGSYSYTDAAGLTRLVTYVADDEGFRAEVKTNEPGTLTSNPADVKYESSAQ